MSMPPLWFDVMSAEQLEPLAQGETRTMRMIRWILEHPEFDNVAIKGKVIFDIGRKAGSGLPAVSATFHPASEDLL